MISLGAYSQVMIQGFNGGLHTGGNTITQVANFPADNSAYSQILMHVSLDCPTGGCDPWDRFANLKVEVGSEEIEIGRYITPYGNDWCDWTIDVTDYRTILTGTQTLTSHIETWQNGWLVNTEFEFIAGTPSYLYTNIQNLWVDYDFTYGDTLFFSINLPEMQVMIPDNAEEVILRIVNTGHGQGNTDNAAEFSQKTHAIHVNGSQEFTQFLWKSDCGTNPCSPQGGTWQFNRAGWCPGQDVTPDDFDITSMVTPGQMVSLDYVLEPFYNFCSPWDPNCAPSGSCPECTYNNNGHTKPHYKIVGQLITKSSTPIEPVSVQEMANDDDTRVYPNPTVGMVNFAMAHADNYEVTLTDLSGRVVARDAFRGQGHQMHLDNQAPGIYLAEIRSESRTYTRKIILDK